MDVSTWLTSLSLQQYERAFRENAIDISILPELTDSDLEKIGVLLGHRKKILKAISESISPAANSQSSIDFSPQRFSPPDRMERRHMTIMFCDLVGSTALSVSVDIEDLRDLLAKYHKVVRDEVTRLGGFVARYMGDGVLTYFGYPEANEDDPERCVQAALNIKMRVPSLEIGGSHLSVRIGIATGLVVVGDLLGDGEPQEYGVVGETPNLAARLQTAAKPNGILIADATRRLIGELFELGDGGLLELKGLPNPVQAWEALRRSKIESRFEALRVKLTPLVGRDGEIEMIKHRWAWVKEGEGQVILLSGEAGIGKSRLAASFLDNINQEQHRRLRYFCSPHHRNTPLYPFIAHLERAAGFSSDDSPDQKIEKLRQLLTDAAINQPQVIALYKDLLSLEDNTGTDQYLLPNDPLLKRELTLNAMGQQLTNMATEMPVVVILEDAHWIDSTSLELVSMVIDQVPRIPALLLITSRPDFKVPWLGQRNVTTITLGRLGKRHTTNLIENLTRDVTLPQPVLAQIVERSDGIPLFIEELAKNILDNPLIQRSLQGTGLDVPSVSQLTIPPSLQASLMARLDRLAPIKEVAQIGAVIGREFSYELLAAVSMRTEAELGTALQRLIEAGIIFRRGSTHRAPCIFKHALIQDAAYSTMLRAQRQELHIRIATVLENQFVDIRTKQPEILAYHCTQGGMLEAAIRYGREAAERALRRSASVEAEQHLSGALAIIQQLPHSTQRDESELRLFLTLGRVVRISDGISAEKTLNSFTRARELISELTTLENQVEVLYGLWGVHYVRAEHIAARDVATECLALAERHSSQAAYATANYIVASSLWATGAISEARRHIETVFEPLASVAKGNVSAPRLASNHDIAALFFFASALAALGYLRLAGEIGENVVRRAKSSGHVPLMAAALYFQALFEVQFGTEPERLKAYGSEAVDFCTLHGVTVYGLWGRICYGIGLSRSGNPEQAIPLIESAMQSAEEIDARLFRPLQLGELALAYDQYGATDVALGLIEEAMGTVVKTQERMCEAELYRIHGHLLFSKGDEKAAESKFMEALETARLQHTRFWELRAALSLCTIWKKRGSHPMIRETLGPLCAELNSEADSGEIFEARRLLTAL